MRGRIIDPGRFRAQLDLQQVSVVTDGMGGHTEDWTSIASVFALVEPLSATATFAADQSAETATHRVTLRARPDVASGMRFALGERVLEIVTVNDLDESGRYLVCRTRETGR